MAIAHANGLLVNELTNCCTLLSPSLSVVCVFGDDTRIVHSQSCKAFTTVGCSIIRSIDAWRLVRWDSVVSQLIQRR